MLGYDIDFFLYIPDITVKFYFIFFGVCCWQWSRAEFIKNISWYIFNANESVTLQQTPVLWAARTWLRLP